MTNETKLTQVDHFDVLFVDDSSYLAACAMYPKRIVIPETVLRYIKSKCADDACNYFVNQDSVFQKEIDQFYKYTRDGLRLAITGLKEATDESVN